MRKIVIIISCCLLANNYTCEGQILKPTEIFRRNVPLLSKTNIVFESYIRERGIQDNTTLPSPILQAGPFKLDCTNTLPKGAIFCRMEDAIYNKLNFWVKFRMGIDDRYSN